MNRQRWDIRRASWSWECNMKVQMTYKTLQLQNLAPGQSDFFSFSLEHLPLENISYHLHSHHFLWQSQALSRSCVIMTLSICLHRQTKPTLTENFSSCSNVKRKMLWILKVFLDDLTRKHYTFWYTLNIRGFGHPEVLCLQELWNGLM